MGDELVPLFMKIGMVEQKAKETAKNKVLSKTLSSVVQEFRLIVFPLYY